MSAPETKLDTRFSDADAVATRRIARPADPLHLLDHQRIEEPRPEAPPATTSLMAKWTISACAALT
jgi:hypothetical protein